MLRSVCPVLPSRNLDATAAFYGKLGFSEVARFDVEGYSILVRDAVELHFVNSAGHDAEVSEHEVFFRVDNATDLSKRFEALGLPAEGAPRLAKAENKPWGICELEIVDPNGNLLRMGHIVDEN